MNEEQDGVIKTSTGELRINCPFCKDRLQDKPPEEREDTGYHLYLNPKKNVYWCHRCEATGKADNLLEFVAELHQHRDHWDIIENVKSKSGIQKRKRTYLNLDMVGSPPVEGSPSWSYLTNKRNLNPEEIRYYDIRSGKDDMRGRIIVPVFDEEGYCIYYSGRTYVGKNPKYKNPQVDKKSILFHLHGVNTNHVIVCEGVFSAIHAGKSAVAILGKHMSNWQKHAIARRFDNVYLAFDGDVYHQKRDKIDKVQYSLQKLGCKVGVIPLPENKDPEDVGRQEFHKRLKETKLVGKTSSDFQLPRINNRTFYN